LDSDEVSNVPALPGRFSCWPLVHDRIVFRAFGHTAPKKLWPGAAPRRTLRAVPESFRTKGDFFRVLGVDPAAAGATGYGVIESDGRRCRMLRFGALRPTRKGPEHFPERLREIHALLSGLIEEFQPHGVAVESVFTALNMRTALKLSEVRGVVLLAAAQRGIPVCSYSPREVKASVAGYGHADKQQIQLMVRALLGMSETPEPSDAADALAVALCHVQAAQFRARLATGTARISDAHDSAPRDTDSRRAPSRISLLRNPILR
jgi:crossover junction endodeoxyribonuclease RuvC